MMMKGFLPRLRSLFGMVLALFCVVAAAPGAITPPAQPLTGPGGAEAFHQAVISAHFDQGGKGSWLFEPVAPRPASAPVVVFLHGWTLMWPGFYSLWIDHLVRRGDIVIFPRYQGSLFSWPRHFLPDAAAAVRDALAVLGTGDHVRPELDHVVYAGHSVGGLLAADLAAGAAERGLPPPADALVDTVSRGQNRDVALGDTPAQRFMGKWSDGLPVNELEVVPNP